jgi:hypothetical protein
MDMNQPMAGAAVLVMVAAAMMVISRPAQILGH